jgi:glutathione S-transferase
MIVCEETNKPYTVGYEVNGNNIAFKSEEHLALHPFGKVPVLIQDKLVLPETASIVRYLDKDKQLQPSSDFEYARHDALCAIISIDIDKVLLREYLLEFAFPKGEDNNVRFDVVDKIRPKALATLAVIEKLLNEDNALSAEQFTLADALLAPMLHYISCLSPDYNLIPDYPRVEKYLIKLMQRPSCQKVLIAKTL